MNLQTILLVSGALISGAILGLKVIAPLTKTKKDDEVLAKLQNLEALLHGLKQ